MANEQITSPIILDSTGIAIKNAIQQVANNVKPDATEINMGPNDSTKISAAINTLSEHIEYVATGTEISNLDNVPLNAKGRISLAGAVSPSGNSLNCSFLCIGSANYRTITIWSTSTGNSWTTQKNGSGVSWSSWISLSEQIEQYSKEYKLDLVGNAPVSIKNNTTTQIIQTGSLDEAYDAIRVTFSWNGISDSKTFETNKTKDTTRGFYTFLGVLFTENNNPTHAYIAVNFSLNGRYMAVKYLETTRDLSTWTAYTGNGITVTEIIGIIRGVQ